MRFGDLVTKIVGKKATPVEKYGRQEFEANKARHTKKQIMKRRAANKRSTQHKGK